MRSGLRMPALWARLRRRPARPMAANHSQRRATTNRQIAGERKEPATPIVSRANGIDEEEVAGKRWGLSSRSFIAWARGTPLSSSCRSRSRDMLVSAVSTAESRAIKKRHSTTTTRVLSNCQAPKIGDTPTKFRSLEVMSCRVIPIQLITRNSKLKTTGRARLPSCPRGCARWRRRIRGPC